MSEKRKNLYQAFCDIKKDLCSFIKINDAQFSKDDFETYFYLLEIINVYILDLSIDRNYTGIRGYAELTRFIMECPPYLLNEILIKKIVTSEKKYNDFVNGNEESIL